MTTLDEGAWSRTAGMPVFLLKEADARLTAMIASEEARQKSIEDKAARYFVGAGSLIPIIGGVVSVLVKSDGLRLSKAKGGYIVEHLLRPDVLSLIFLLLIGAVAALTSAWAMEVFKAREVDTVDPQDVVPEKVRVRSSDTLYYRTQVAVKYQVVNDLHSHNEKRGQSLRIAECIALRGFTAILIFISIFVLLLVFGEASYAGGLK